MDQPAKSASAECDYKLTRSLLHLSTAFTEAYNQGKVTDYSNPLRGIVPKVVHKDDVDESALVELIEKLEGEVAFGAYVKALCPRPKLRHVLPSWSTACRGLRTRYGHRD
jgi:hypothetical protein